MEFLIKTYNSNRTELITAAAPDETDRKIKKYLDDEHIRLVEKIPESTGVFCVKEEEDDIYYIHRSFYDKGYETHILYSLQWASWTEKHAATLEALPEDPPELIRE
jgi:hypothetical protein